MATHRVALAQQFVGIEWSRVFGWVFESIEAPHTGAAVAMVTLKPVTAAASSAWLVAMAGETVMVLDSSRVQML